MNSTLPPNSHLNLRQNSFENIRFSWITEFCLMETILDIPILSSIKSNNSIPGFLSLRVFLVVVFVLLLLLLRIGNYIERNNIDLLSINIELRWTILYHDLFNVKSILYCAGIIYHDYILMTHVTNIS